MPPPAREEKARGRRGDLVFLRASRCARFGFFFPVDLPQIGRFAPSGGGAEPATDGTPSGEERDSRLCERHVAVVPRFTRGDATM